MSDRSAGRTATPESDKHRGTPFASHTDAEVEEMLDALDAASVDDLFDIPDSVRFEGTFGIERRSEQAVRRDVARSLDRNEALREFLGRGHYEHYVPSLVDHLADRSEFLTSYTQYQPEASQGFLQALFEYQSMLVELTGLDVANCSMYDPATALGEAVLLADRVRATEGSRVLVPAYVREERRDVLENYTAGAGLAVETVPTEKGLTTPETLDTHLDEDVVMAYVENPTAAGLIEEHLGELGGLIEEHGALFCLGSDPVALSLLERPADVGADVVVGDASALGLPAAYGMGLGLFACRRDYLRQVPGRLVGAGEDAAGNRAYTLTLQTREQHIRRERATSNICTNQAWVALRAAIHAAWLGPEDLLDLAKECVRLPAALAADLDDIPGVSAPVVDGHHFREFRARTDRDARAVSEELSERGFAIHALGEEELQICVTEANAEATAGLVEAFREVLA